ncbi:MAG: hypothetical protein IAG10_20390, partial [Planctomycetaceae bacterium]|nr:hypothetical protein [Planctomycetaceae bacterium]
AGVHVQAEYPEKPAGVKGPVNYARMIVGYDAGEPDGYWPGPAFAKSDKDGKFVVERLIPGQKHSVLIKAAGASEAKAVTDALVPRSGETTDLGVIRLSK